MDFEIGIDLDAIKGVENKEEMDIWGAATLWLANIGAEYNLCYNGDNCSAIYFMSENNKGDWETDYDDFEHYEIDAHDIQWEKHLKEAMVDFVTKRMMRRIR